MTYTKEDAMRDLSAIDDLIGCHSEKCDGPVCRDEYDRLAAYIDQLEAEVKRLDVPTAYVRVSDHNAKVKQLEAERDALQSKLDLLTLGGE